MKVKARRKGPGRKRLHSDDEEAGSITKLETLETKLAKVCHLSLHI